MALLLRDVSPFFTMVCTEFPIGQAIEMDVELPNPLGGPPLPALQRMEIIKATEKRVTYLDQTVISQSGSDALWQTLTQMLRQGAEANGKDPKEVEKILAEMPPLNRTTTSTVTMSRIDGLPLSIQIDSLSSIGPMQRSDQWRWLRVDGPAATPAARPSIPEQ